MSLLSRLSVLLHTLCVLAAVKKTARPYDEYCTGRYLNGKQLSLFLLSEQQELRSCRFYTDKDSAKGENVVANFSAGNLSGSSSDTDFYRSISPCGVPSTATRFQAITYGDVPDEDSYDFCADWAEFPFTVDLNEEEATFYTPSQELVLSPEHSRLQKGMRLLFRRGQ